MSLLTTLVPKYINNIEVLLLSNNYDKLVGLGNKIIQTFNCDIMKGEVSTSATCGYQITLLDHLDINNLLTVMDLDLVNNSKDSCIYITNCKDFYNMVINKKIIYGDNSPKYDYDVLVTRLSRFINLATIKVYSKEHNYNRYIQVIYSHIPYNTLIKRLCYDINIFDPLHYIPINSNYQVTDQSKVCNYLAESIKEQFTINPVTDIEHSDILIREEFNICEYFKNRPKKVVTIFTTSFKCNTCNSCIGLDVWGNPVSVRGKYNVEKIYNVLDGVNLINIITHGVIQARIFTLKEQGDIYKLLNIFAGLINTPFNPKDYNMCLADLK